MKKQKVEKSKSDRFTEEFRALIKKYNLKGVGIVCDNIEGVDNAIYTGVGMTEIPGKSTNADAIGAILNIARLYQYMREGVLRHNWFG